MASVDIDINLETRDAIKEIKDFQKQAAKSFKKVQKDTEKLQDSISGFGAGLKAIGAILATGFVTTQLVQGLNDVTQAAIAQEDAIKRLETSLKLAGTFSEAASEDMQNFASALQGVTTVGDETTLELLALARNFARSNEEAKALTSAAVDLSAATGISLESAITNLGKTFGGLTGELGESVPALRELTAEQLKAGEAIDLVAQRFGGAAKALRDTFSGALQATTNDFGDLLEELGFAVVQNKVVISLFNDLADAFKTLGTFTKDNRDSLKEFVKDGIVVVVRALSLFTKSVVENFDTALKAVIAFSKGSLLSLKLVKQGFQGITFVIVELARSFEFYRKILALAAGDTDGAIQDIEENRQALAAISDQLKKDIVKDAKDIKKEFEDIVDGLAAPKITPENNEVLKLLQLLSVELDKIADKSEALVIGPTTPAGAPGAPLPLEPIETELSLVLGDVFENLRGKIDPLIDSLGEAGISFGVNLSASLAEIGQRLGSILTTGAQDFAQKSAEEQEATAKAAAEEFVAGVGGAVTDVLIPGAGGFVTELLKLATDPESFVQFIEGFTKALPEVINGIVEALPLIIDAFIENLPAIVDAIVDAIPRIIDALIEAAPDIIIALARAAPRIAIAIIQALINATPKLLAALVETLGGLLRLAADEFLAYWNTKIVESIDAVAQIFRDAFAFEFGSTGDIGGTAGDVIGAIGSAIGFQRGGIVPPGFPNDSFPARLTSGEMVLTEEQQDQIDDLIATASMNGRTEVVNAQVKLNEQTFADIVLELSRDNRRLA